MDLVLNLQRLAPAIAGFDAAFNSTNSQVCSTVSNQNCTNTSAADIGTAL